jgi:hypothetical protein
MPRIGHSPLLVIRPRRNRLAQKPTRILAASPCRCSDCTHLIRTRQRAWSHSGGVACGLCGQRFAVADPLTTPIA